MTKEEFLARCEAYRDSQDGMKPVNEDTFVVMREALEYVLRKHWGQEDIAKEKREIIEEYAAWRWLAGFSELYSAECFAYRLCHTCAKCAKDPRSWETRYWLCNHK